MTYRTYLPGNGSMWLEITGLSGHLTGAINLQVTAIDERLSQTSLKTLLDAVSVVFGLQEAYIPL